MAHKGLQSWRDAPGRWLAVAVGALGLYGVTGYWIIGYHPAEALHNTLLVLTTVGYQPEPPVGLNEKLFTASIAATGVAMVLAALALFSAALAEGRLGTQSRRKRMQRRIGSMSGHYIVCAYGRVGRAVAREFEAEGTAFAVIDRLEELEARMRADGLSYLIGDPTAEHVLRAAGIERARGLISAVDSDADNVYIVLTARSLNPEVFIVARASESAAADRLYRAGANRVISPYVSSGRHMASLALHPGMVDTIDLAGEKLRLEEMIVEERMSGQPLAGVCGSATPLVLKRAGGQIVPNPEASMMVERGDVLVLLEQDAKKAPPRRSKSATRR